MELTARPLWGIHYNDWFWERLMDTHSSSVFTCSFSPMAASSSRCTCMMRMHIRTYMYTHAHTHTHTRTHTHTHSLARSLTNMHIHTHTHTHTHVETRPCVAVHVHDYHSNQPVVWSVLVEVVHPPSFLLEHFLMTLAQALRKLVVSATLLMCGSATCEAFSINLFISSFYGR